MTEPTEPAITINGTPLTTAQAMTVRVAIESFGTDLTRNGLGDDDTGKAICAAYQKRISELRKIMYEITIGKER